jgi:transposase-like protein
MLSGFNWSENHQAGHAELAQLRRENRTLRLERDILKKAAAFFAKESA